MPNSDIEAEEETAAVVERLCDELLASSGIGPDELDPIRAIIAKHPRAVSPSFLHASLRFAWLEIRILGEPGVMAAMARVREVQRQGREWVSTRSHFEDLIKFGWLAHDLGQLYADHGRLLEGIGALREGLGALLAAGHTQTVSVAISLLLAFVRDGNERDAFDLEQRIFRGSFGSPDKVNLAKLAEARAEMAERFPTRCWTTEQQRELLLHLSRAGANPQLMAYATRVLRLGEGKE
jgi:hypothetical protein